MIYLHIGLPKSGSSAIQVYLNENHKKLMDSGVMYPWQHGYSQLYRTSGGNAKRILSIARNGYLGEEVSCLKNEIKELCDKYNKLIISSEALSVFFKNPADLSRLLPSGIDVRIVIYLRNQVEKFVSDVNQTIKNARRDSYDIGKSWFDFNDYKNQIRRWERAFGKENIVVRGYDKSSFPRGDVVADFCSCVDIPYFGYDKSTPINPSLNLSHMEVMRNVNILAKHDGEDGWAIKQKLKDIIWKSSVESSGCDIYSKSHKKPTFVKKSHLEDIAEVLSSSNSEVESEYGVAGLDLKSAIEKYTFVSPVGNETVFADILYRLVKEGAGGE